MTRGWGTGKRPKYSETAFAAFETHVSRLALGRSNLPGANVTSMATDGLRGWREGGAAGRYLRHVLRRQADRKQPTSQETPGYHYTSTPQRTFSCLRCYHRPQR